MVAWSRDVFSGGGEARAAARAVDWASTSLGAREKWSEHVLTVVDLCLSLDIPAMVCWGPDLVQVYNEPCCALLGRRHPSAMGQAGKDCWGRMWESLAPGYERLSTSREPERARGVRLPVDFDDPWMAAPALDLTFVPIRAPEEGVVAGVLILAHEATGIEDQRHLRLVSAIAGEAVAEHSELAVCRRAADALVEGSANPFALVYLFEGPWARLAGCSGLSPGEPLAPEQVDVSGAGGAVDAPWRMAVLAPHGHEVRLDPRTDPSVPRSVAARARAAAVLPMIAPGRAESIGVIVVGVSGVGSAEAERESLRRVATVTAAAVEAARAYARLLRRCDALAGESEARSRFTASVAHELRTPLNAIVAHAELLKEGFAGRLEGRQARHVDRIASAAMHLLELIEGILELSRTDRADAEVTTRDADIRALVEELADLFRPLFRARALDLDVRVPRDLRPIRTDPARVRQILINLLSNAQKYTDAGGVQVVVAQKDDGTTTVAVTDTGRGIDQSDQTRIFEPFRRIPRPGDREGTGLGLAVADSLARLLGGALRVRSEPGAGSTFTLSIPDLTLAPGTRSASSRVVQ